MKRKIFLFTLTLFGITAAGLSMYFAFSRESDGSHKNSRVRNSRPSRPKIIRPSRRTNSRPNNPNNGYSTVTEEREATIYLIYGMAIISATSFLTTAIFLKYQKNS